MINIFLKVVAIVTLISLAQSTLAQQTTTHRLKVGDTVPSMLIEDLVRLSSNGHEISPNPQLFLLHFWNSGCMESLKTIPSIDSVHSRFAPRCQLVLISPDSNDKVKKLFERINYVPTGVGVITQDLIWNILFPNITVPQHVWLNGKGEVLYITEAFNATGKNLQAVLSGKRPQLLDKMDDSTYSIEKPLWNKLQGQRTIPTLYTSTVTGRLAGVSSGTLKIWDTAVGITGIRIVNQTLLSLFKAAFTNRGNEFEADNRIILNIPNPETFKIPRDENLWNDWLPHHIYCYELTLPLKKRSEFLKVMRQDLGRYFGYEGVVETRSTKCLILRNLKGNSPPKTDGGKSFKERRNGVLIIRNLPIRTSLYSAIKYANQNFPLPVLNETREQKIDLDVKADLTDIPSLRTELRQQGFDLAVVRKKLAMLVIRPSKM